MRILSVNFEGIKSFSLKNNKNFSKQNLVFENDKISFTSKTLEQKEYIDEAKALSKEAYVIFARGKKIQNQSQAIVNKTNFVLTKAYKLQSESQDKWFDIQNAFEYAKEFNVKAYADPVKDTQTIFEISNKRETASMVEYRNGVEIRKVHKEGEITELIELDSRDCFRGFAFFYHMNWGWEGMYDGYYLDTRMYMNIPDVGQIDYQNDRKDIIFNKLTQ